VAFVGFAVAYDSVSISHVTSPARVAQLRITSSALGRTSAHVILSAFHSVSETIAHAALFAVVAYVLLRPKASAYFRVAGRHPEQPAA
jgi:hypothetical protein